MELFGLDGITAVVTLVLGLIMFLFVLGSLREIKNKIINKSNKYIDNIIEQKTDKIIRIIYSDSVELFRRNLDKLVSAFNEDFLENLADELLKIVTAPVGFRQFPEPFRRKAILDKLREYFLEPTTELKEVLGELKIELHEGRSIDVLKVLRTVDPDIKIKVFEMFDAVHKELKLIESAVDKLDKYRNRLIKSVMGAILVLLFLAYVTPIYFQVKLDHFVYVFLPLIMLLGGFAGLYVYSKITSSGSEVSIVLDKLGIVPENIYSRILDFILAILDFLSGQKHKKEKG